MRWETLARPVCCGIGTLGRSLIRFVHIVFLVIILPPRDGGNAHIAHSAKQKNDSQNHAQRNDKCPPAVLSVSTTVLRRIPLPPVRSIRISASAIRRCITATGTVLITVCPLTAVMICPLSVPVVTIIVLITLLHRKDLLWKVF